ncbi:hypothetical protein [Pseudoalteromonas luteoviolacea]|uniref:Insecticide toxin TcdB middle/N-terminal domain-containing protein n=1 Tax=Pseudoalteromonas luteoviolacea S4060-1 TaxID=1365257 RepID=A0A167P0E4_9GAMM|nr:hypothetical protein [Pseudoalteromonas luteoviolacea]KZN69231.1 hypothetical protein N478_11400 [Pseudoalteromonas luteoviolacea S4060-1]
MSGDAALGCGGAMNYDVGDGDKLIAMSDGNLYLDKGGDTLIKVDSIKRSGSSGIVQNIDLVNGTVSYNLGSQESLGYSQLTACTNCTGQPSFSDEIDMPREADIYDRARKEGENGYPTTEYLSEWKQFHIGEYEGDPEILFSLNFEGYLNENRRFGLSYNYDLPDAWRIRLPTIAFAPELQVDVYNVQVFRRRVRYSSYGRGTKRTHVQVVWEYRKEVEKIDTKTRYVESIHRGNIRQSQSWPIVP